MTKISIGKLSSASLIANNKANLDETSIVEPALNLSKFFAKKTLISLPHDENESNSDSDADWEINIKHIEKAEADKVKIKALENELELNRKQTSIEKVKSEEDKIKALENELETNRKHIEKVNADEDKIKALENELELSRKQIEKVKADEVNIKALEDELELNRKQIEKVKADEDKIKALENELEESKNGNTSLRSALDQFSIIASTLRKAEEVEEEVVQVLDSNEESSGVEDESKVLRRDSVDSVDSSCCSSSSADDDDDAEEEKRVDLSNGSTGVDENAVDGTYDVLSHEGSASFLQSPMEKKFASFINGSSSFNGSEGGDEPLKTDAVVKKNDDGNESLVDDLKSYDGSTSRSPSISASSSNKSGDESLKNGDGNESVESTSRSPNISASNGSGLNENHDREDDRISLTEAGANGNHFLNEQLDFEKIDLNDTREEEAVQDKKKGSVGFALIGVGGEEKRGLRLRKKSTCALRATEGGGLPPPKQEVLEENTSIRIASPPQMNTTPVTIAKKSSRDWEEELRSAQEKLRIVDDSVKESFFPVIRTNSANSSLKGGVSPNANKGRRLSARDRISMSVMMMNGGTSPNANANRRKSVMSSVVEGGSGQSLSPSPSPTLTSHKKPFTHSNSGSQVSKSQRSVKGKERDLRVGSRIIKRMSQF